MSSVQRQNSQTLCRLIREQGLSVQAAGRKGEADSLCFLKAVERVRGDQNAEIIRSLLTFVGGECVSCDLHK